jgi:hypothetical protein
LNSTTDGHGLTRMGRAGSPLPAVGENDNHGAHGVTRPTTNNSAASVSICVYPWLKQIAFSPPGSSGKLRA